MSGKISTPIAYIVFNRPRHTRDTFAAIRNQQPSKLFIIGDGPRSEHPTDAEYCQQVRKIVEEINWPCEVQFNYAEVNLGIKRRVTSGLDWVFSQVDKAIVLEDDCLPHPDFFSFCDALLERYAENERVWVITGNNFQNGRKRGDKAYYFSKYNHCWGWATWRRAWEKYEGDLPFWPEWGSTADWKKKMPDKIERQYWSNIFDKAKQGEIDSWAYPWVASIWFHGGLTATPNVNLVTNIGIGPEGTHTLATDDQEGLPSYPLGELTHPDIMKQNIKADRYAFENHFGGRNYRLFHRMLKFARLIVRKFIEKLNSFLPC